MNTTEGTSATSVGGVRVEGLGLAPERDLVERMRERGNALRCHPAANGTITHTEQAGELLAEASEELARLRAHCADLERWKNRGEAIFTSPGVGVGFRLGEWWADRPWRAKA